MNAQQRGLLRFVSLLFLLPGLAGLIFSAIISIHCLEVLPRMAVPAESRMTPRNVHGTVVYQTDHEDRRLMIIEDTSVSVFLIGLGLGMVYLRKWGIPKAIGAVEND